MKKSEQERVNGCVLAAMEDSKREYDKLKRLGLNEGWFRLNSCQAWYLSGLGHWVFLKSYRTIVAVLDTRYWVCYDFSRYVYGYTATTSYHIHKFAKKMGATVVSFKAV